jgi:uncharacterized protein YecE (DUF72 family)
MDGATRIGTAGWAIPRPTAARFPGEGSILERYGRVFSAAEIDTSFYRPHKRATYERWAASTPDGFVFAVKVPKAVTHDRRLVDPDEPLARFFEEIAGLGDKLGPVLIQLPPSLTFDETAAAFVAGWRHRFAGPTAIEPRHPSWFAADVEPLLVESRIARVGADPAKVPAAAEPGGWRGLTYLRLHGSPVMYASPYAPDRLPAIAATLAAKPEGTEGWCIFDNTRSGAAAADALALVSMEPKP